MKDKNEKHTHTHDWRRGWRRLSQVLLVLGMLGSALGTGCVMPPLRGTPYYSDDDGNKGSVGEERINVWPLLERGRLPGLHL